MPLAGEKVFTTFNVKDIELPTEILVIILGYATSGRRIRHYPRTTSEKDSHRDLSLVSKQFYETYKLLKSDFMFGFRRVPLTANPANVYSFDSLTKEVQAITISLTEVHDLDDEYTIPAAIRLYHYPQAAKIVEERLKDIRENLESDAATANAWRQWLAQPQTWAPAMGESVVFHDLREMARFFSSDTPATMSSLRNIKFLSVAYRDDKAGSYTPESQYAYQAFEGLYQHKVLMSLKRIHIGTDNRGAGIITHESPGIWSLLKLRGLTEVFLTGWNWRDIEFGNMVRKTITQPSYIPWAPLGIENPGIKQWEHVKSLSPDQQYQWLDQRYQQTQDWDLIVARRKNTRKHRDRIWGGPLRSTRRKRWRQRESQKGEEHYRKFPCPRPATATNQFTVQRRQREIKMEEDQGYFYEF